jgi:hypothetical protein
VSSTRARSLRHPTASKTPSLLPDRLDVVFVSTMQAVPLLQPKLYRDESFNGDRRTSRRHFLWIAFDS